MTRDEFFKGYAYLRAGVDNPREVSKETLEVWFDVLRDLTFEQFKTGCRRFLQQEASAFPTVAQIRRFAVESDQGQLDTAQAAFETLRKAVRSFGRDMKARGLASLDPLTRKALEGCGGWEWACELTIENRQAFYAQFRNSFQAASEQVNQQRVLTEDVRPKITNGSAMIAGINSIGDMPKSGNRIEG